MVAWGPAPTASDVPDRHGTTLQITRRISVIPLLLGACGPTADSGTDGACDTDYALTWDAFGDPFFHTWCRSCHSAQAPQRFGAPPGIDFDTEDQARTWADTIRSVVIEEQSMPLGGGVSEEQRGLLELYLDCGL